MGRSSATPGSMSDEPTILARKAIIVGASGGIGAALAQALRRRGCDVIALSRGGGKESLTLDIEDEESIESAAGKLQDRAPFDLIIIATGMLHAPKVQPEKTYRDLNPAVLAQYFALNATGPALVARYFLPLLERRQRAVFAVLSARVGSVSDNRLGGWYGYRASKAALNMIVKCLAIEVSRTRPNTLCLALHPGTVDTPLSKPFQKSVPSDRLFSGGQAAERLLGVIEAASADDNGRLLAWDGSVIAP